MPTRPKGYHSRLIGVPKLVASAHLAEMPSPHASLVCETPSHMLISPQRYRAMPLVCESSSPMLIAPQRYRIMPTRKCNAISFPSRRLPSRCSGRASLVEIVRILESEFVPTALSLSTARR
jgi:hypothetical protein